jgi:hypothetical protein
MNCSEVSARVVSGFHLLSPTTRLAWDGMAHHPMASLNFGSALALHLRRSARRIGKESGPRERQGGPVFFAGDM